MCLQTMDTLRAEVTGQQGCTFTALKRQLSTGGIGQYSNLETFLVTVFIRTALIFSNLYFTLKFL